MLWTYIRVKWWIKDGGQQPEVYRYELSLAYFSLYSSDSNNSCNTIGLVRIAVYLRSKRWWSVTGNSYENFTSKTGSSIFKINVRKCELAMNKLDICKYTGYNWNFNSLLFTSNYQVSFIASSHFMAAILYLLLPVHNWVFTVTWFVCRITTLALWNFVGILSKGRYRSLRAVYCHQLRLNDQHISNFPLPVWLYGVLIGSIDLLDPKNLMEYFHRTGKRK